MKCSNYNFLRVLGVGVVAGAVGLPALAQSSEQGGFDKPLKVKAREAQPGSSSTSVMRQDDGDNSYEVRIADGKISAKVNGKEVPADRIVRDGEQIKILGKDGATLTTFQTPVTGGKIELRAPRAGRAMRVAPPAAPDQPEPPQAEAPRPKVMVGIYMDQANDEQVKEAGLDEGMQAIVIQGVVSGLPAEKAGVKEGDIITEIDGQKPATQEKLREVLMGKKAGDTVTLTVHRESGDKAVRVKLEKYDAERLPMPKVESIGPGDNEAFDKRMKDWQRGMPKEWPGGTFVVPDGPEGQHWQLMRPPGGKTDERLADLDKRMAELDEKLSRLNDQMAKLEELIEKMSKRAKD